MNIEKCYSHRNNHRYKHDTSQTSYHQKHRAGKLTENSQHQGHITSKAKNTWKCIGQLIEMCHLIKSVHKKQYAKKQSDKKDQNGNTLSSEIPREQKIVKHSSSF